MRKPKRPMPAAIVHAAMLVLRAAIVFTVVVWVLNIPGRLRFPLYTEQMLVFVLGLSLALTFLMYPCRAEPVGEAAIAERALTGRQRDVGFIDAALAVASLAACCYVARALSRADQGAGLSPVARGFGRHRDRAPGVRGEPPPDRLGAGRDRAGAVRARDAGLALAGAVHQPAGRAQPADGLSRHRHQRACSARPCRSRSWSSCRSSSWGRCSPVAAAATSSPTSRPR